MTDASEDPRRAARDHYRDTLRQVSIQSQQDYDKTLITLASGALGVSFVFIKDVLGGIDKVVNTDLALAAWLLWSASLSVMLASYLTGALFLDRAVTRLKDPNVSVKSIRRIPNIVQTSANILGGLCFIAGVISLALFAFYNLGSTHAKT